MDQLDIAIAVRQAYPTPLQQKGVAHLVIDENGLIVWFDAMCSKLFHVAPEVMLGNSLNLFLPENMQGAIHDRLIQGVFNGFRKAFEEKSPSLGLQAMGKRDNGNARTIKAYDYNRQSIEFTLEFAPLKVAEKLYAVAFILSETDLNGGTLTQSVQQDSELVIKNARLQIVADAGEVVGTQFSGVFGFYVNQIFGASRAGRIASGIFTFLTFGGIVAGAYLFFDSRFGTKPQYQQYQIGEPQGYPAPPHNSPELQSPPGVRSTSLPKREN